MSSSWLESHGEGETEFDRVFALAPDLAADYHGFADLFFEDELLPRALLELLRIQAARLLDCPEEVARRREFEGAGEAFEGKIRALGSVGSNPIFDESERAALAFAEKFIFDVHGMSDADVKAVRNTLGVEGTVALCEVMALYDGFTRFRKMLGC